MEIKINSFSSVQLLSHIWLFATPWTVLFSVLHQLPELAQTHVYWVHDAIPLSHPLSSPFLPAFNFSQHQSLSNESSLHISWPKYWSFSFSISASNEYLGLISFRILVGSPCSPKDSQESSPTQQFKSISSSVLSFLYGPNLTSIHDYWKSHRFDWTDLCWQNNGSSF